MIPIKAKGDAKRVTGQRILTSAEGLAILKEKEDKKQKQVEEKQKRKQERENKKKEKEEVAEKKSEEKVKKASSVSNRAPPKRAATTQPKGKKKAKPDSSALTLTSTTSTSTSSAALSVSINTDECCECLGTYEDDMCSGLGEEWVECACGRWMHEKCIDQVVIDAAGKERFCSFCVV